MPLADDIHRFSLTVDKVTKDVFVSIVAMTKDSIVSGSEVTGAPGQPVDTGNLKALWRTEFESPTEARISTNVAYALSIEDGVSYAHGANPMTLRSEVGGFHSVALTAANFGKIVAQAALDAERPE